LREKPGEVGVRSKGESGEGGAGEVAAEEQGRRAEVRTENASKRERWSNSRRKLVLGDGFMIRDEIVVPGSVDVGVIVFCFGVGDPRE